MRKIWLVIAAVAVISCKQEAPVDYALLSGTILNSDASELSIKTSDNTFSTTLSIDNGKILLDTLRIKDGIYILSDGDNYSRIHISKGSNIVVNFDATDFWNSLEFTGKGSEISSYLLKKNKKASEIVRGETDFNTLDEAVYKAKCQEIAAAVNGLLEDEGMDEAYKAQERRVIHYEYLNNLSNYESNYRAVAKQPDFKVSEGFLAEMDAAVDNEEDYKNLRVYRKLLERHYKSVGKKMAKDEGISNDVGLIKALGAAKNDTIKNDLLQFSLNYGVTFTHDLEGFYAAFMEVCTDEEMKSSITETYNSLRPTRKGQPSPNFEDYENYAGGTTSLADLKGKYVFVDVWATWCGPCIKQIPYLKEVEKQYHGKNIEFVSISIDRPADNGKWKAMVKDKELGGIQLIADKAFDSDFVKGYVIKGVPQFILIDPEGNIISRNTPWPQDRALIDLFNEYGI